MKNILILFFIIIQSCISKSQETNEKIENKNIDSILINENDYKNINLKKNNYNLNNFYNKKLDLIADSIIQTMNNKEIVGQMIIVAYGKYGYESKKIKNLIELKYVGGILMLNGEKNDFISKIKDFKKFANEKKSMPIIFSADAEPTLINQKIIGTKIISKTNTITDNQKCIDVVKKINEELNEIGIQHNFAPVSDLSLNKAIIGNRSFSNNKNKVIELSKIFIETSMNENILTTIKHFPGHGLVKGDSHKNIVFIDGKMQELQIFEQLIGNSLSIMIGHIIVKNNEYSENNLPASCSRKIVTNLLREKLKYKGIIITDALNMGALSKINSPAIKAILAGNDMIIMPSNEIDFVEKLILLMNHDDKINSQIKESVKRIIKLKICLKLI